MASRAVAARNHMDGQMEWPTQATSSKNIPERQTYKVPTSVVNPTRPVSSLAKELGPKTVDPLSKQLKEDVGKLTPTNYGITDDPCRPLDLSDSDMQIINDSALMKEHSVIARQADAILTQELRESGHYRKTGQAYVYAISLPVFGTNGEFDNQTQLVIIRLIQAMDSITTDTYLFTKGFVDHVIGRMEKEVSGVSKISYDGRPSDPSCENLFTSWSILLKSKSDKNE